MRRTAVHVFPARGKAFSHCGAVRVGGSQHAAGVRRMRMRAGLRCMPMGAANTREGLPRELPRVTMATRCHGNALPLGTPSPWLPCQRVGAPMVARPLASSLRRSSSFAKGTWHTLLPAKCAMKTVRCSLSCSSATLCSERTHSVGTMCLPLRRSREKNL